MDWTEERIEKLARLVDQGLSASQIAEKFGDVSRAAVIGKAYRTGLKLKGGHSQKSTKCKKKAMRKKRTPPPVVRVTLPPALPVVVEEPSPVPLPEPVKPRSGKLTLLELGPFNCRWPIGEPRTEDFHFCGKLVKEGKPYCAAHCKRAYDGTVSSQRRNKDTGPRRGAKKSRFALGAI